MSDDLFVAHENARLFAAGFTRTVWNGQIRWLDPGRNDFLTREEALRRMEARARVQEQAPAPPERQDPSAEG